MARIPSIQALRALESVARLGTIWQAAEELNLTRSAISHQLRLLERELDFQLMLRVGNRIELSSRAQEYAEDVRRALALISTSSHRHAHGGVGGPLAISCPSGFSSSWMCRHLSEFVEQYPDVIVSLVTPIRLDSTNNPEIDTFITFGHDGRSDMVVEPLQPVEFTPLCSPEYLERMGGFPDSHSLLGATLLHIGDFVDWEAWMRKEGLPAERAHRGICFSSMNVVHTAVLAGQGIAIGDVIAWREDVEAGRLARPFEAALHSDTGYYLCTPVDKLANPVVIAFHRWLKNCLRNPPFSNSQSD
ncbi:LysR substrate-binding domain-containing protein [Paracoccus sp. MBLB3053]|uniref:LysR substrate-binding domain-containing protein n=1 Tax=Paracoccus aurantius TaxID=3073814 RepID=A0ABU2HX34_9RHOB|nr:LysR substrate-binding domain-containing protein [Paracoccus sp. MBLB3053]MDS9469307.1 LysR substrate-binding domain-containing protein [Paracoccus sp. MBLB3053]